MYWAQWFSTPQPGRKVHFRIYTRSTRMRRGLYFLCICFEALCTRLLISEDHMNFCGCVSTSVLSGNGCWIHTKTKLSRRERGHWMFLVEATEGWCFRNENQAAKTELESGMLLLKGPPKCLETPERKDSLSERVPSGDSKCASNSQAFGGLPASHVQPSYRLLSQTLRD